MRNKGAILFTCFFLLMIGSMPVIQAVYELHQGKPIQVLDPFRDTFTTPFLNSHKQAMLLDTLHNQLLHITVETDSLKTDTDISLLQENLGDALATARDIKRAMADINTYVSDSTARLIHHFDPIVNGLQSLQEQQDNEEHISITALNSLRSSVDSLRKTYNGSVITLVTRPFQYFFRYTMFNQNYLRKYEKNLEHESIVENTIRPVFQFIRYALLGDVGDKAILGRNGWLFYRPDVEYLYRPSVTDRRSQSVDYNDKPLFDNPITVIDHFRKQLRNYGIDLLVVIVPGKPSIYPDLISSDVKPHNLKTMSRSLEMTQLLRNRGVDVVDLFHPFLDERQKDSLYGDSLYLKLDTHWKSRGLRCAARVVAEAVQKYPWYDENHTVQEYCIDSSYVYRNGDVGVMTKLPDLKIRDLQMNLPPEKTLCFQVFSVQRDSAGNIISKKLYRDEYQKSRILVLGDSFSRIYQTDAPRGAGWIAHLACNLSEPLASIVNDGGASTIVRQILSRKLNLLKNKKLVIWEFVERDFRFGAEGWKDVSLSKQSTVK